MQNILGQLQNLIKTQFGLESQLDILSANSSIDFNSPFGYLPEQNQLHVPLYDNKKEKIIGRFKVYDIEKPESDIINNIHDLVSITLQSYLDLMNKLDMANNVLSHMQLEINPNKVIPLNRARKNHTLIDWSPMTDANYQTPSDQIKVLNHEILIYGRNKSDIQKLFSHLHEVSKNYNMITIDKKSPQLIQKMNDFADLSSTTLIIPDLKDLSDQQIMTLTELIKSSAHKEKNIIIAASIGSIQVDQKQDSVLIELLQQMHFFYIISDQREDHGAAFGTLQVCAETIVQMVTSRERNEKEKAPYTCSYNIVPLIKQGPTLVH